MKCVALTPLFIRDVDRREVDFVVTEKNQPRLFVECKQRSKSVSRSLRYLKARFPGVDAVQLYRGQGPDQKDREGIRICPAHIFLSDLV